MRTLKLPRRDDPIRADDIREMVLAIMENNVTAGTGLAEEQTPHGKILRLKQVTRPNLVASAASPRAFDLEPGATAGKKKLVRCYYQIRDVYIDAADTEEFTPAAGNLCAVINTSDNTVSAQIDFVYDSNTPELIPLRVYVLDADGGVVCDCRGSQVVIYG